MSIQVIIKVGILVKYSFQLRLLVAILYVLISGLIKLSSHCRVAPGKFFYSDILSFVICKAKVPF